MKMMYSHSRSVWQIQNNEYSVNEPVRVCVYVCMCVYVYVCVYVCLLNLAPCLHDTQTISSIESSLRRIKHLYGWLKFFMTALFSNPNADHGVDHAKWNMQRDS